MLAVGRGMRANYIRRKRRAENSSFDEEWNELASLERESDHAQQKRE